MKPDLLESNLTFYDIVFVAMIFLATNYNRISIHFKSLCKEMDNSNRFYASKLSTCSAILAVHCFMVFNKALLWHQLTHQILNCYFNHYQCSKIFR